MVLYCAQDREYAEALLADFTAASGLAVAPKFDTEAQKSVGLYEELVREAGRPRCGVFWNNEILNTIRLQRQGLLDRYESPAAAPYPEWTKAKDRTWQAFAARARVLIVNTYGQDMTVVELGTGEGWYTELLAPFLAKKGKLLATSYPADGPPESMRTV